MVWNYICNIMYLCELLREMNERMVSKKFMMVISVLVEYQIFLFLLSFLCSYFFSLQWTCNIYIKRKNLFVVHFIYWTPSMCQDLPSVPDVQWGGEVLMHLRTWKLVLMLPKFQKKLLSTLFLPPTEFPL